MRTRVSSTVSIKRKKIGVIILSFALIGIMSIGVTYATTAKDDGTAYNVLITNDYNGLITTDGGKTWMDEKEHQKLYPTISDIIWWTYDDYKEWLAEQKKTLPNFIGGTYSYYDEKGVLHKEVLTQEKADEAIIRYERTLETIKNGAKVSRFVNGDESIGYGLNPSGPPAIGYSTDILLKDAETEYLGVIGDERGYSLNPSEPPAINYSARISLKDAETKYLGAFATEEERLVAVEMFCYQQVKAGKMTQQEADKILNEFK